MFISKAHSFKQQAQLAITLAWVAGYTNVITLITLGATTSHVTGSTSSLGRTIVEGKTALAMFAGFLIGVFLVGAAVSGFLTELAHRAGRRSIYVLPMALEALMLAAFAFCLEWAPEQDLWVGPARWGVTALACLAMGLQNATITRISAGVVRTTHMTGVVTDLGIEIARFSLWSMDAGAKATSHSIRGAANKVAHEPSARRVALLASLAGSFAFGAALGTLIHEKHPPVSMFPPVLFLLWIIFQDVRQPIAELEPSRLESEGPGLGLPPEMLVVHLRRDLKRREDIHRLPDLSGWVEALPSHVRIIVLELGEVRQIDEDSALELRATLDHARASGRTLILSGIDAAQFSQLRQAVPGTLLDPINVCADFELALARGVLLSAEGARSAGGRG